MKYQFHVSSDQTYFDVKLTDGWEGRVDILYDVTNNIWGTLCSDYTTIYTAQVVCRQLGFFSGCKKYSFEFDLVV